MPRSVEGILKEELIGLPVRIGAAPDPGMVGVAGVVVDETRETFHIRTPRGERTVAKRGATFTFTTGDGPVDIPGDAVAYRPEDRIKKARWRA